MNIGYHSDFMDRIIERADKRQERMEKMINKMLDKSEPILQAGKPKPQTNEEWLRSATTEELATMIYGIAVYDTLYDRIINVSNPLYDDGTAGVKEVMKWLKEKHNEMS